MKKEEVKTFLKHVMREGEGEVIKFKCPKCGIWGDVDDDQYNGKVSILCECEFHEIINLKQLES